MYRFDYEVTEQDYFDFNYYVMLHDPAAKRLGIVFKLVLPMIPLFVIVINLLSGGFDLHSLLLPIILLIGFVAAALSYDKRIVKRAVQRTITGQKKRGKLAYYPQGTITLADDAIVEETPTVTEKCAYTEIVNICEHKGNVYIFRNSIQAYILPSACMDGDEQRREVMNYLRSKCNIE